MSVDIVLVGYSILVGGAILLQMNFQMIWFNYVVISISAQKESESKGKSQPSARVSSDEEIQDWLRTCKKRLSEANETTGKPQETLSKDKMFPVYELSDCLRGRVDVPPSLLPPTPEDMQNVIIDGWG